MQLPPELEQAIEVAYVQMLQDPHHSLIFKQRLPIYQALEKSHPLIGVKAQGWLAFLAAQKVLVIWEKEEPFDTSARTNLELAEEFLTGKLTREELEENHETTLMFLGMGLGQSAWDYSDEANYAYITPGLALAEALGMKLYKKREPSAIDLIDEDITEQDIELGMPDEIMSNWGIDTASAAVCAYSGISFDWDALDKKRLNANEHASEILAHVANTFHPNFKPA